MKGTDRLQAPLKFAEILFERMIPINAGIKKLALYEFRFALENVYPAEGWESVHLDRMEEIERTISQRSFYESIQLKPRENDRIILDAKILHLTRMLFVGLVRGEYSDTWITQWFYFDVRGFYFLPRTRYFTDAGRAHLGGKPLRSFEPRQKTFEESQDINYLEFEQANAEIDREFIGIIHELIAVRGSPILITIAGPTAAGKTEITERLLEAFGKSGKRTTTIEMDNFLRDRDYRDGKPMGKETVHFDLFKQSLQEILLGRKITIPRYDALDTTSSHALDGKLKPGHTPIQVEPADVIFLEGNFPFQIPEVAGLIGIKIVYLTDDPVRLKRKWKRDVDYRKSYESAYFRNRFFATQFLRAEDIYQAQIEICDIVVDTTGAAIWVTPEIAGKLNKA